MNSLLILGAGGHGKVVADAALATGDWREIAFLDDRVAQASLVLGLSVIGEIGAMTSFTARFSHAVVAVGDARRRLQLTEWLHGACDRAPEGHHKCVRQAGIRDRRNGWRSCKR
jgi:FlaA1/EpsC-like NDP-sugar epimerase